jgi:hypothetical protein
VLATSSCRTMSSALFANNNGASPAPVPMHVPLTNINNSDDAANRYPTRSYRRTCSRRRYSQPPYEECGF